MWWYYINGYSISKATSTADTATKEGFAKECNKLRTMFSKLRYPKTLFDYTINKFSQEPDKEIHTVPLADPSVYIVFPFKDQRSVDRVRKDISSLVAKIDVNVKPVFISRKLSQILHCLRCFSRIFHLLF